MTKRRSPFTDASPASPPKAEQVPVPVQRFTLRLPVEIVEKTRSAWLVDGVPRGVRNVSAWVEAVLAAEIARVEQTHGPLPLTPPGVVPSGWDVARVKNRNKQS